MGIFGFGRKKQSAGAAVDYHRFDAAKRQALVARVEPLWEQADAVVVGLEQFFEGNDDHGSIGCNLAETIAPQEFYRQLQTIREQDGVQDVLVQIAAVEDGWPFSDTVYVLTAAPRGIVENWVRALQPDDVQPGYDTATTPAGAPELQAGHSVYRVWWD